MSPAPSHAVPRRRSSWRGFARGARLLLGSALLCLASPEGIDAQRSPLTNAEYDALSALVDEVVTGASVCDVALLPAGANRPETVIAVVDYSGRLFCNSVVRVSRTTPPSLLQEISGWWVASLHPASLEVIQDVDGDGEADLVVPTAISDYEGPHACIATLPFAYRCGAGRCIDVSAEAPRFYRHWRERLAVRLREAEQSTDDMARQSVPCLVMEIHKTDRLLGASSTATLRVADEWRASPDPYLRRKAVWMLSDLWAQHGDPAIRDRLDLLAETGHEYAAILSWLVGRKRAAAR